MKSRYCGNSEERAGALATAARRRLGDDAETWLDTPHPALGNKAPRAAAAADVNGYERAIGVLQSPQAVAA